MATDEDAEPVLAQVMAARLMGGISVMGGTLVLTATRVVFLPLIGREGLDLSNKAAKIGQRLHRHLGQDHYVSPQRLLNTAIRPLTARMDVPLAHIQAVSPTRRCAVLVTWVDTGKPKKAEFAIMARRMNTIWNPENVPVRDRFLAEVTSRLPQA